MAPPCSLQGKITLLSCLRLCPSQQSVMIHRCVIKTSRHTACARIGTVYIPRESSLEILTYNVRDGEGDDRVARNTKHGTRVRLFFDRRCKFRVQSIDEVTDILRMSFSQQHSRRYDILGRGIVGSEFGITKTFVVLPEVDGNSS